MSPPSQRYRSIGFFLTGGDAEDVKLDLTIRPEDLSVQEPSRLVVQQTIGGAWADAFGRGQVSISLSGMLGWRGGLLVSGEDAFAKLRQTIFLDWHQRRTDAIAAGTDPDEVKLSFVDTLDELTFIVAPQQFSLRRSKSSPLLMRYQIRLLVLDDADAPNGILDQISRALNNPLRWLAGITGLGGTLGTLMSYYQKAKALFGQASAAVRTVVGTAIGVLQEVSHVASAAKGIFTGSARGLLTTALGLTRAVSNALTALATDGSLPIADRLPALRLASTFNDANCTMANCFSGGARFVSYDDLSGASACSSTGGGEPISLFTAAGVNPFEAYFPPAASGITVSPGAAAAMASLIHVDPLILLGRDGATADSLRRIAEGVQITRGSGATP